MSETKPLRFTVDYTIYTTNTARPNTNNILYSLFLTTKCIFPIYS